jgi:hypothetical protein
MVCCTNNIEEQMLKQGKFLPPLSELTTGGTRVSFESYLIRYAQRIETKPNETQRNETKLDATILRLRAFVPFFFFFCSLFFSCVPSISPDVAPACGKQLRFPPSHLMCLLPRTPLCVSNDVRAPLPRTSCLPCTNPFRSEQLEYAPAFMRTPSARQLASEAVMQKLRETAPDFIHGTYPCYFRTRTLSCAPRARAIGRRRTASHVQEANQPPRVDSCLFLPVRVPACGCGCVCVCLCVCVCVSFVARAFG